MDIEAWLDSLGLGEYAAAFREHRVDAVLLARLTEDDLKEIGVLAVGDRRRLLAAIAAFQTAPAARAPSERRHLTVLFCDIVGSTALSARLDPEDMHAVISAYHAVCADLVGRHEGFIAELYGDGVLAYFGYPAARENDPHRAVRAGLAIAAAMPHLETPANAALAVRVGIATGMVVVGNQVVSGSVRKHGVVGDTPNLAARLMSVAEPGAVVVAETTRRLIGGAFELTPLGPQRLKGFDDPLELWTVRGEDENLERFEAANLGRVTEFVGREEEVAALVAAWRKACDGEGQVVVMSGEAGIGKSRILAALREAIGIDPRNVWRYQCQPHRRNDAFHPVVGQMWRFAGFVSGEPPAERLAKLEAVVSYCGLSLADNVPPLAAFLSIPTEGRYPELALRPDEIMERIGVSLVSLLEYLVRIKPRLLLVEDAHWIDPSTLRTLNHILERVSALQALVVVTHRPEFETPWRRLPHAASIVLDRLDRDEAERMVDRVAAGKDLPAEVRAEIVAKADGVPLFVEELTKSVLESGVLREDGGVFVLTAPLAIPDSLQDSLAARLDRLGSVKQIAQIGAAAGRQFSYRLVEAISPYRGEKLDDALRQIQRAGLIYGRGEPPDAIYTFKHALVQDAAYKSMVRSQRRRFHGEIAKAMTEILPDDANSPATIAHHFTEAGQAEPAARYRLKAAEAALAQSAPTEAERQARDGLAMLPDAPPGAERDALELQLLTARANALTPLRSISATETYEALGAAKAVLDRGVGDDVQRASILFGLCSSATLRGNTTKALEVAGELVASAGREDNEAFHLVGHRMFATIKMFLGRFREALEDVEAGKAVRDPARHRALAYRFGWDPTLAILCYDGLVRAPLGQIDGAARAAAQVRSELEGCTHTTTIASARFCVDTWPKLLLGDFEGLERDSAALAAFCAERKVEQIRLLASFHHAFGRAMREPLAANLAAMRSAYEDIRATGDAAGTSIHMATLAEAYLRAEEREAAEAALDKGLQYVESAGERYWLADLNRLKGRLAMAQPQPDLEAAEGWFEAAMEVARAQEARLLELRAAVDLAGLWRGLRPERDRAALLSPILQHIDGGDTAADVIAARAALAS